VGSRTKLQPLLLCRRKRSSPIPRLKSRVLPGNLWSQTADATGIGTPSEQRYAKDLFCISVPGLFSGRAPVAATNLQVV